MHSYCFERPWRRCVKSAAWIVVLLGALGPGRLTASAEASTFADFFAQSAGAAIGDLDRLAPRLPLLELPLTARAFDRQEARSDSLVPGAYASFSRWHFWMGEHFDQGHLGLWGVDPTWTPMARGRTVRANAWLNALQLLQLDALANMAARRELVYDALVWWTERRQLKARMSRELYDAATGSYADLDSTGSRTRLAPLEAIAPIALGAPHVATRTLQSLRSLFADCDSVVADPEGLTSGLGFVDHAREFTVALRCTDLLFDRKLRQRILDALALRGEAAEDPIHIVTEFGAIDLASDDLGEPTSDALQRARIAIVFLRRGGFVSAESYPHLEAHLDSLLTTTQRLDDATVDELTDALVQWRGSDLAHQQSSWLTRRAQQPSVDPQPSEFHLSDSDAPHWIDRALDLLAEVVVGHTLRSRPSSGARLRFVDDLRGSGDSATLELELPPAARATAPEHSALLWTDGIFVRSPIELAWKETATGFRCDVEAVPQQPGLYSAIVTGIEGGPRSAPSLAVVEPLAVEVIARTPERSGHPHRILLQSRVDYPLRGAIEIEAPLTWTPSPSARITYALGPRQTRILDVRLTPGPDASPGHYPVQWHFYDGHRQVCTLRTEAVLPFRWVGIGPFAGPATDFALPAGLLPVDFSSAVRSATGPVRWHRIPTSQLGRSGELQFDDSSAGWNYALTAFTTGSRQARITVDSTRPWIVFVNGRRLMRSNEESGLISAVVDLVQGANEVLVGSWQDDTNPAPCGVRIEATDKTPLAGADDNLEMNLEGYAYVQGDASTAGPTPEHFERETLRLIPLSYTNPAATSVSVVGSFNGWSPDRNPMTRDESGKWVAGIRVPPGRFEYKFAVDGQLWIADPANPHRTADGFGGENSLLIVE